MRASSSTSVSSRPGTGCANRIVSLLIDLDEIPALSRRFRLLSIDRFNLFSIRQSDFGAGTPTGLRDWVAGQCEAAGIAADGPIRLLAMPRVLGHAFNPLSVFFCYRADGGLAATLYEVRNTFGERHSYLIPAPSGTTMIRQSCRKTFYVSPFMPMEMEYRFRVMPPARRVSVVIDGLGGQDRLITASLSGRRVELTDGALLRAFLGAPRTRSPCRRGHPLGGAEIVAQEGWAVYETGATRRRHHNRCRLIMSSVLASTPPLLAPGALIGRFVLTKVLKRIAVGRLVVRLPSGDEVEAQGPVAGPEAELVLHNWTVLRQLVVGGDIGFAESYMDGHWSSPDLPALIELAALNQDALGRCGDRLAGSALDQSATPWAPRQYKRRQPSQHRLALRSWQ